MENKNTSGRFGSAESAPRKTGSYRIPPAGSYKSRSGYADAAARRPAGFGSPAVPNSKRSQTQGDGYTRRPVPERSKPEVKVSESKPKSEKKRVPGKGLLIVAALIVILLAIILLSSRHTIHALPTITRESSDSSFVPEATTVLEHGDAPAAPSATVQSDDGYSAFAPETTAIPGGTSAAPEATDASGALVP